MMPKGIVFSPKLRRRGKQFFRVDLRCLWGNQMFGLNIFVYVECDLVRLHNIGRKSSTILLRISHMSIKHDIHGVFQLDYKKKWIDVWPN
jgi:hypothetical protein